MVVAGEELKRPSFCARMPAGESSGAGMAEWEQVITAARRLAVNAGDPSAAADFGSGYGLALLMVAQSGAIGAGDDDLMLLHGETWLGGANRSAVEIRARLESQLRRYSEFPDLPAAIRHDLERLIGELSGPPRH
jgi:hypothetical protein